MELTNEQIIQLNVGGHKYQSFYSTLTKYPETMLSAMFLFKPKDSLSNEIFIDRDGEIFKYILNYLRDGQILLPPSKELLQRLLFEAEYFQIKPLKLEIEKELQISKQWIDDFRDTKTILMNGIYKCMVSRYSVDNACSYIFTKKKAYYLSTDGVQTHPYTFLRDVIQIGIENPSRFTFHQNMLLSESQQGFEFFLCIPNQLGYYRNEERELGMPQALNIRSASIITYLDEDGWDSAMSEESTSKGLPCLRARIGDKSLVIWNFKKFVFLKVSHPTKPSRITVLNYVEDVYALCKDLSNA